MNQNRNVQTVNHWIDGQIQSNADTNVFESLNPADESLVCRAQSGTEESIDQAVQAAHRAFGSYRQTTPSQREQWLLKAAELLASRETDFVEALIIEIGSPITKARREISTSIGILRAAAGATRQVTGKSYPTDMPGRLSLSVRRPLGVIAGMTPFNVPLIKAVKHSAMPLATGNTVVLLPSEQTPWTIHLVGQLFSDAGFPPGSFNVVFGSGAEIGDTLTNHPLVSAVGFTGSAQVGRHVQRLCGANGKRVTLELGGKNPLIVLNDAELSKAIQGCILGSFLYQGQICMSSSRIFVQEEIADIFEAQFVQAAENVACGNLREPQTMVGPIISRRQIERVRSHLGDALSKGAKLLTGNRWEQNVLMPTVLTDVNDTMQMHDEETFGPVTTLTRVQDAEEAIQKANQSDYGLCGSVYTNSLDQALDVADRLEVGMVHINATTIQEEPHVPFGGTKQSGFGREGSQVAIDELTEWKWITLQ